MSCLTALDSQIVTLFSVPHEILFLQHKVFREYAKIAVGSDFIHTLPSFLILTSMAIVLWRNPPSCNGLAQTVASTAMYKAFQEPEYRDVSHQWWQQVWSSYYPPPLQPPVMSADFISWLISMSIATTCLGCAVSTNQVWNIVVESTTGARDMLVITKCYANAWFKRLVQQSFQGKIYH
ncbi:hypothetical protein K0M31_012643 [Melipona bicolor]|uniref:Uncharacterized protein n=1 Tax=Melipona bicolor TaxID=60889 RepID=A0AA40FJN2_9HYME|nr:hypothetical protein K0M31_012643 [Melipona bicolor]